jgi:hypothetical protein
MALRGTVSSRRRWLQMTLSLPTSCRFRPFRRFDNRALLRRKTFGLSADVALKLTPNFGIEVGDGYQLQKSQGSRLRTGFDNVSVGGKYQFLVSAEHEAILSIGVDAEIGGTGRASIGADRFSTMTATLFFGKGFGDLPDSAAALRPFALIPINSHTGNNVGVLAQIHFYLDDVLPKLFGKALFGDWP